MEIGLANNVSNGAYFKIEFCRPLADLNEQCLCSLLYGPNACYIFPNETSNEFSIGHNRARSFCPRFCLVNPINNVIKLLCGSRNAVKKLLETHD